MRIAYADPPYIGQARKRYRHDPACAEVDHAALIAQLESEYDGWALSLSAQSLPVIAPLCAAIPRIRFLAWVKPFCAWKSCNPAYSWEPVIIKQPRKSPRPASDSGSALVGGIRMTPSTLIAVADAQALRLSDGRTFPRTGGQHTPDHLLGTCKLLGITDLYLHPSAPECAWGLWKKGEHTWIHPTPYDAWIVSTAAETRAPWCEAPDGLTLLAAVEAFRDALKCDYYRSPGSTGLRLLRGVHTGPHALALDLPAKPPAPAREVTEGDLVWMRNLVGDEPQRRYLHTYDRNRSYLAACSSLPLGMGAAEHIDSANLTDADTHLPGYFRVHIPPAWKWLGEYDAGLAQPPPCHIDVKGRQVWITTPTYRLLDELGAGPCITEAWVWREHHRVLEPWYKRLRDANNRLMQRGTPAERIALGVLKEVYVQAISWFTSELWERDSDPLYRPDWRHQIIAQARANTFRVIRDCYEEGRPPFACATDELFFLSDDPDPLTAAPRAIRCNPRSGEPRMSHRLGHWKVKHSAPMSEIVHVWEHKAFRLGTLTTALKERENQQQATANMCRKSEKGA